MDSLTLQTKLSTDTSLSQNLDALRRTVVETICMEERETLGNDLATIAMDYRDGWYEGSDEDDD